jgi:hypothetical protein
VVCQIALQGMRLRGKLVGALEPSDIIALIDNRVSESKTLEFKQELPGRTDSERKEFLADCTAMANTAGGVILYGVRTGVGPDGQNTGIAEEVVGIEEVNRDKLLQRLKAMLHDGVSPSLAASTASQFVEVTGEGQVLALGFPRSLLAPHRVSFSKSNRFHRRSEVGNYEPDVPELRQMFLETATWVQEVEAWRE